MGFGSWSASSYAAGTGAKIASGTSFGYTSKVRAAGHGSYAVHPDLDPKKVAGPSSPFAGEIMRESRDNEEHPNSTPVAVFFDETGSMGGVPRVLQTKLAGLFGLLMRKGYTPDPQVLIGAYGDSYCDRVPLQVGQFESDNRIDSTLDNIFIEQNGGGNNGETMSLAWYYLAKHTVTDSFEKRNKKGYAFFVADERSLDLEASHIKEFVGDMQPLVEDLSAKNLAKEVQKQWNVFILLIDNASAKHQGSQKQYEGFFGKDNVLIVQDPNAIAETIAMAIGFSEGTLDSLDADDDLAEIGTSKDTMAKVLASTKHLVRADGGKSGSAVTVAIPGDTKKRAKRA